MGLFGNKERESGDMSFFDHVEALRPRLFRSAAVLLLLVCAAFACKEWLMTVIMGPQSSDFVTNRLFARLAELLSSDTLRINSQPLHLINTTMAGQFNMHLSLSFYAGLIISVPYISWELWGFVRPALTERELGASRRMVFYVTLCFFTGVLFGYFVLAPLSVNFLSGYTIGDEVENMIDFVSYVSLVSNMTFACGAIFLLPVLVSLLSRAGLLSAAFMKRYRRHALIVLSILSALITPPDVASMVLVLLPLYGLYELSICIAKRHNNDK